MQIETPAWVAAHPGVSQHYPLVNELRQRDQHVPILEDGQQVYGVTRPQWLGPMIAATKDKPVRIVFHNLLPDGRRRRPLHPDRQHLHGRRAWARWP